MHFEYIEISVPSTNSYSLTGRPFLHPVLTAQLYCFKKIQSLLEKIQSRIVLAGLIEISDFFEFCHNWERHNGTTTKKYGATYEEGYTV